MRLSAALSLILSTSVIADDLSFTFSPPTTREDGTALPLSEISHYNGALAGPTNKTFEVANTQTGFTLSNLGPGLWCATLSTTDTEGRTGAVSNISCKTIEGDLSPPGPPVLLLEETIIIEPVSADIPTTGWTVASVSAEAPAYPAVSAFDRLNKTYWYTYYSGSTVYHPHHITIDMGKEWTVTRFRYRPRGSSNAGRVKDYSIEVSLDNATYTEVSRGVFPDDSVTEIIDIDSTKARYFRFTAYSNQTGYSHTSVAELFALGY